MAEERAQNLQDTFLNHVRKAKIPHTIFLVNGVKLQGVVTWFDNFCVLLRRDGHSQLVYKHAISTIMRGHPISLFEGGEAPGKRPKLEPRRRDPHADRLTPTATGEATGRAIVIEPWLKQSSARTESARASGETRTPEARLAEAVGLAGAIDLNVVEAGLVTLNAVRPATYIGTGKVEEIAGLAKSLEASVVVMDCPISPVQQRNLEKAWACKVIDRTGLILEIFGRRARTKEGALQVELAHLSYQKTRLVRAWTHLERQRGGFGFGDLVQIVESKPMSHEKRWAVEKVLQKAEA